MQRPSKHIKFSCPHCGQHIEAPADRIGDIVSCPTCAQNIHIGKRSGEPQPPPVPDHANQPPPTTAGRSIGRRALLISGIGCGGASLLLAFLLIVGVVSNIRLPQPTSTSTTSVNASPSTGHPPVDVPPVELTIAKIVDERLFLLRLLEELYSQWPTDISQPQELQKRLGELRHRANRHYEDTKKRGLDETVTSLYADFITALDAYAEFLGNIGKIETDAVARAERESAESGFNAGRAAGEAVVEAQNNGASGSDVLLAGTAVGVVSYLWDDYNKGKARDSAKQQALQASVQKLANKISTYLARAQNASLDLGQKYSWQRGEAGFDDPPEQTEGRVSVAKANDIAGRLQIMDAKQRRRPRDPFALSQRAYIYSLDDRRTPKELVEAANQCLAAASLVPAGRIYDEYRGKFLYTAGDIATRASTKEIGNGSWATAYNSTAAYAIRLWDECLRFAPNDPTGDLAERRAWVLMQSGHLKEASDQASSIQSLRGNTVRFAYIFSCLLSSLGDTDSSFKWFEHAVRNLGYSNIAEAKADPDLASMRNAKKTQFDDLTKVRWSYKIDFGLLNDDIIVRNDSLFPLTNVVFRGNFTSDGRTWKTELKAQRINPGQSYTWSNVFSIPGSKIDPNSSVSLASDQNGA